MRSSFPVEISVRCTGFLPAALTAKIAAFSVAAYTIARSLTKAAEAIAKLTPSPKDDAVVAEVGKVLDAVAPKQQYIDRLEAYQHTQTRGLVSPSNFTLDKCVVLC